MTAVDSGALIRTVMTDRRDEAVRELKRSSSELERLDELAAKAAARYAREERTVLELNDALAALDGSA